MALPFVCWVIEGKLVRPDEISGVVQRLGRRELEVRLDAALAPLTNIRFRLTYPALGHDSSDVYGKVVGAAAAAPTVARIRLTAVDPADDRILASLLSADA